jgi:hypothetical protein
MFQREALGLPDCRCDLFSDRDNPWLGNLAGLVALTRHARAGIILGFATVIMASESGAREFGGYDCSDDCSGHAAGYRWAEVHTISSEADCPLRGGAISFYEGCPVYVEYPSRGADEDDDGDGIDS